jgi:hypothetical protein
MTSLPLGALPGRQIRFATRGRCGFGVRVRVARIAGGDPTGSRTIVVDFTDFVRITHDGTLDSLAVWLRPGTDVEAMRVPARRLSRTAPARDPFDAGPCASHSSHDSTASRATWLPSRP